ncbi:MAG: phosphoenolpyruvate hydrolase family protein [Hyphomicrobiales bacterium]|nr:phosphoenolpyruvate hydrolase family protein [Hyphomicrobiales bacterium]
MARSLAWRGAEIVALSRNADHLESRNDETLCETGALRCWPLAPRGFDVVKAFLSRSRCHGYATGSSAERYPVTKAVRETVAAFDTKGFAVGVPRLRFLDETTTNRTG